MYQDGKSGGFNSTYLTNKVTTETEYELRLRIIKEKQEERLEALTAKIRVIYEDIKKDSIIISMRNDPASSTFVSQRMREISQDHMALEREETIDRLTEEVAYSQTELKKLDKELKELKHNLQLTQEGFHSERQRFQSLEAENKMLRSKLVSFSKDIEVSFKQKTQEYFDKKNRPSTDTETLEKELWEKSNQIDFLAKENEDLKDKIESLKDELGKVLHELKESERTVNENNQKMSRMNEELLENRKEKEVMRDKQVDYGQQIKNIMDYEEKSHKDSLDELNATFKEKSTRFKKKILDQKKIIQFLEGEVANAREAANNCKIGLERSLLIAQDDLKRVKEQWEKRCREIEKEHSLMVSDLQVKHQAQISELQRHYQELLEEKIKDFQAEHSSNFSRQRALDYELKKIMDEKLTQIEKDYVLISKHEAVLNEEISKLRIKHLQEVREIEENWNRDLLSKIKEIKDSNFFDNEKLAQKISLLEKEKSDLLSANRTLESDLQFTKDKLENQLVKVIELKKEINNSEISKKNLFKEIEEHQLKIAQVHSQLEEEQFRKTQIESDLDREKSRVLDLQTSLKNLEKEMIFKHKNENSVLHEQISTYEEALAKEQQRAKRILTDMEHYQKLCTQLEREIEEVKEVHSRETQDFFTSSQRLKQDERIRLEKEIEGHLETKRQLIQAEHKAKILESELKDSERVGNELRMISEKYEKEVGEMRRNIAQLENNLSQNEKVIGKLRKELECSKEDESSVRIVNKKILKENLDKIVEEC